LDPHGMILLSTEFYHPKKKNYVLKTKGKKLLDYLIFIFITFNTKSDDKT